MTLITDSGKAPITQRAADRLAQAGAGGYFDDGGFPVGKGWDEIAFPAVTDEHAYALEISGDSMKPAYRDGDIIVVSPAAPVRRGDRVVVKTKDGEVMVKELKRKNRKNIELKSLNSEHRDRTAADVRRAVDRAHHVGEPVAEIWPVGSFPRRRDRAVKNSLNYWVLAFAGRAGSLGAPRQRAVDHVDGVLQAIDRDEGAEARAFLLAEQHLVEHVEPVERDAGLAVLGLLLVIEERLAAADLVDHVLDVSGVDIGRQTATAHRADRSAPRVRRRSARGISLSGSTKSRK